MAGDGLLEEIDAFAAELFESWNISSTVIVGILFLYLIYPLLTWKDPDTHPFLLARQAGASPVRQQGESALYRSIEVPYGYPLRTGLGVKDPGAPRWSTGRNGDLRDIWRQAARGPLKDDGNPTGSKGKIVTVLGRDKVFETSMDDITRNINAIGKYLQESGVKTIAICLPNSAELIAGIFAAAFYEFRAVLVPYGIEQKKLSELFAQVSADAIVTEAGSLELKSVISACPSLKQVIWVTKAGSQHMDWNEVPEGIGGSVGVSVWRELVEDKTSTAGTKVAPFDKESRSTVPPLTFFWPSENGVYELVEFTSENIVAAVVGLNAVLPRNYRLGPEDLVLSVSPLTMSYPLSVAFLALFSGASLALNSVAGDSVDITTAATGVSPTVIVSSPNSVISLHKQQAASQFGLFTGLRQRYQKRTLQSGIMPIVPPVSTSSLSKLRLLMVAHRAEGSAMSMLPSSMFTDLRLFLGTRIVYALTTARVAGAVSQTNALDYRQKSGDNHFGPPLSCVEIAVAGSEDKVGQDQPEGKLVVKGPAVCHGEVKTDILARIDDDNTLVLL